MREEVRRTDEAWLRDTVAKRMRLSGQAETGLLKVRQEPEI